MEGGVRVRLRFEDEHLLSESQKLEGLNRCWLFLSPQLRTISDLDSYLTHKFSLQEACPNGLLLYMNGFVLPPFESTCIFRDKDIIRIKRKGGMLIDDRENHIEESQIVEKQPLLSGVKLLTIEESEKETQVEHEEPPEDALHLDNSSCGITRLKKRKHSDDHNSPKGLIDYCLALANTSKGRRKARSATAKEHQMITDEGIQKDVQMRKKGKVHRDGRLSQKRLKKGKSSNINCHSNVIISTAVHDEVEDIDSMPNDKGDQLQVISQKDADTSLMLNDTKKFPSRSARRKKAKRKWLRELVNSEKKELTQNQMLEKEMPKVSPEHQPLDQNTDVEDEVVAVEIRPGHIRFEPQGKEQSNGELKGPMETFQWSGTTSKRKGQKWGIEKTSFCRRNGDDSGENSNEKVKIKDSKLVNGPIDFEKLVPLSGKPKVGDVIAYRLVELSSSWCPEISSFRVGKISSYDPLSGKVMLVPVPEYPLVLDEKKDEAVELLSINTLYNEDGTLEIDFTSLIDVRVINRDEADPMTVNGSQVPVKGQEAGSSQQAGVSMGLNHNTEVTPPPVTENGGQEASVWDDIAQALSVKKSQLQKNNSFGAKETPDKGAWSYRALRRSALGPTMALLRSQNDGWG
ncbi:hypothetical protein AAC387_Pa12g0937 [Persea americana]